MPSPCIARTKRRNTLYLETFTLPIEQEVRLIQDRMTENGGTLGYIDNIYPCDIFPRKGLRELSFARVTILYGGNGSGKSTLLNLIAAKLGLNRVSPFNSGELFDAYAQSCAYKTGTDEEGFAERIPNGSRIITSDDVFDYMLAARDNNAEIGEAIEQGKAEYAKLKFGDNVVLKSMDDYEALRLQVQSRRKTLSRRKFLRREVGTEVKLNSNGETALAYFRDKLKNDRLYCLDEPENSMSPKTQQELVRLLEEMAHYCGCQFILATHSPFLLSMSGARIYDLDTTPVTIRNWWELESMRVYHAFFEKHRHLFTED